MSNIWTRLEVASADALKHMFVCVCMFVAGEPSTVRSTFDSIYSTDHMQGNKFTRVARDLPACDEQSTRERRGGYLR